MCSCVMKQWRIQCSSGGWGNLATPESYPPCRMSWYHGELCRPVNRCVSVSEHIGVAERSSSRLENTSQDLEDPHGGLNQVARNKRSSSCLWRIHPRVHPWIFGWLWTCHRSSKQAHRKKVGGQDRKSLATPTNPPQRTIDCDKKILMKGS